MAPGIVIVGLGPGAREQLTLEAWQVLSEAGEVYLRTNQHPTVPHLPSGPEYHSFDEQYETLDTFEQVYEEIARRVLELGRRPEGVLYATPGHPLMGETATLKIIALAREAGLPLRVVAGVSFLEPVTTALGIDPFDGLQICDATILARKHHPNLDPDVAALVVQVYNRRVASEVKMTLLNLYHEEQPIRLVRGAGTPAQEVCDLPLYALDRRDDLDHLSSVYIPPLPRPGSLATFGDVVARLRAPGGCPWDREQTHQTLRTHLLEETYEVLAALDEDNMKKLEEELGDLLLQIFLHAQIATEDGDFRLADSTATIIEKLIRRHPHVFGQTTVQDAEEVLRNWEQIKREERGRQQAGDAFRSMLAGVSAALPALSRAMELQRRAARVGFDWPNVEPVLEKVTEEAAEVVAAPDAEARAAEFGDLLFSLVNLARWYEIDAESALRQASARFVRRFETIERHARAHGLKVEEMTLEQMDALWNEAKDGEA